MVNFAELHHGARSSATRRTKVVKRVRQQRLVQCRVDWEEWGLRRHMFTQLFTPPHTTRLTTPTTVLHSMPPTCRSFTPRCTPHPSNCTLLLRWESTLPRVEVTPHLSMHVVTWASLQCQARQQPPCLASTHLQGLMPPQLLARTLGM